MDREDWSLGNQVNFFLSVQLMHILFFNCNYLNWNFTRSPFYDYRLHTLGENTV